MAFLKELSILWLRSCPLPPVLVSSTCQPWYPSVLCIYNCMETAAVTYVCSCLLSSLSADCCSNGTQCKPVNHNLHWMHCPYERRRLLLGLQHPSKIFAASVCCAEACFYVNYLFFLFFKASKKMVFCISSLQSVIPVEEFLQGLIASIS